MRELPAQIRTPRSASEITSEVKLLLRAAGVKTSLPTPKSEILACARLVEAGELDLAEFEESFTERARELFHRAFSKVRGFMDRRTHLAYVDPSLPDPKRSFVTYHEVVHKILPWQHISCTEEDDATLSAQCLDLFESEANFGAAEILFQCERFEREAQEYQASIASAVYLADRYGASRHATFRRFVERNRVPCVLLVLTRTARENLGGRLSFYVVYSVSSKPFTNQFGAPLDLTFINPNDEIGEILNDAGQAEIVLSDLNGFARTCNVECFSNSYHEFVLVRPKEFRRARRIVEFQVSSFY
jgi:hypothetical protein